MARERRDFLASFLGVIVFLAGLAIVGWVFFQALGLFTKAPEINLGIPKGKPLDFNVAGINLIRLVLRILLLVLMAGIGSAIANRGARLYASGKTVKVPGPDPEPEATPDE